jgi:hypothetical protein
MEMDQLIPHIACQRILTRHTVKGLPRKPQGLLYIRARMAVKVVKLVVFFGIII